MTVAKIDAKLASNAALALEPLIARLYANPGMRILGVVEIAHKSRTQPAPDEDEEASVKLVVKHLEIARDGQEEHLRRVMRALYLNRTAAGKLDEDGEVELSERTLALAADVMHAVEASRLRVACMAWRDYARQALFGPALTEQQLRNEMQVIADGLGAVVQAGKDEAGD